MTRPVNQTDATGRIQSIDRAIELLDAIAAAPEPDTAPALADRCGLNRSTAWRILATLEHHGLVEREPHGNRYSLGFAVLKLAAAAGHEPLVRLAHPLLRRLAERTGETVNLAVARRLELVYADQVQAPHVMAPNWLGHTVPLHATSTGKAFLAALPQEELDAVLRGPLERFTDATIVDPRILRAELEHVHERGYALSHGELELALWGVSAVAGDGGGRPAPAGRGGGGVPAVAGDGGGRPAAVVSVWGSDARVRGRLDELGAHAAAAARELDGLLTG